MTLQEYKLELLQRGYAIGEKLYLHETEGDVIQVVIAKIDTDGLTIDAQPGFPFDAYLNEEFVVDTLRSMSYTIEDVLNKRHAQNPNTCQHIPVNLATGQVGCAKCTAKLGMHNELNKVKFNITINNN